MVVEKDVVGPSAMVVESDSVGPSPMVTEVGRYAQTYQGSILMMYVRTCPSRLGMSR